MKRICFIIAALMLSVSVFAQMDEMFYHPDKEWTGIKSTSYEEITFLSGKDAIHTVLFKPAGKPKATIIYFHGNGGNISKWEGHIKPLVDDGFQVCMIDYRGYGKSTGIPTHLNIAEDAQKLFDTLMKRRDVKRTPIVIYGASIGSQVATLIARNNNAKISGLVLDGAMTSFTDVAVATSPPEQAEMIRTYVGSPYSAKENLPQLKNIRILFIHSPEDFIPVNGARQMCESVAVEKDFWEYEGAHVMAPVLYPVEFVKRVNGLL